MSGYDLYVFFLCLIVFTALTALFTVMITMIVRLNLKTIRHGLDDEQITKEYAQECRCSKILHVAGNILAFLLFAVLLGAFLLSLCVQFSCGSASGVPSTKIILSGSMSVKHDANTYLAENRLHDQLNTFDLVFLEALPQEEDLELYDIVVYEYQGDLIIHRIIGIEEPNDKHPNCRHFLLRGDAVRYSDEFPVLYSQMRAIYRGNRIPYVGSFFAFMQSPAGYLCILLVVCAMIATPIAEKKLRQAKLQRLQQIGVIQPEEVGVS
jgi:hypothetical protein